MTDKGKPLYMIGVVSDMLKLHPQTLRFYEKKGLVHEADRGHTSHGQWEHGLREEHRLPQGQDRQQIGKQEG